MNLETLLVAATSLLLLPATADRQQAPPAQSETTAAQVLASAPFKAAEAALDRGHNRLVSDIIALTEIPAPPFKEDKRAAAYLAMLRGAGLSNVERDAEGNVMGLWKGTGDGPLIAMAAHLDTVFPEGTDVHVTRTGTRLAAPGVGDDSRGLAVLLAMVRAMDAAGIHTSSDILFVGDVGEEGPGDLRGMKHLFLKGPYKDRIRMFISMDGSGPGDVIVNGAVGSKRYRVTFSGPGGHSYGAFGLVNPTFALGRGIAMLSRLVVPKAPKTTYNVGVLGGGTSVNSIPTSVWMDVDLRSAASAELTTLDETFRRLMQQAADQENSARSTAEGRISVALKLIGDRPSGQTSPDTVLARTAAAAVRAMGMQPSFEAASTDANIPISLGIPAITIDSGGTGGRPHSLDEWIDVDKAASLRGIDTALLLLLSLAGIN